MSSRRTGTASIRARRRRSRNRSTVGAHAGRSRQRQAATRRRIRAGGPLLGPSAPARCARTSASASTRSGRKGPTLRRERPCRSCRRRRRRRRLTITYTETAITVSWPPSAPAATRRRARTTACCRRDARAAAATASATTCTTRPTGTLLTTTPVTEPRYVDSRMTWGATRCYAVRTVETVGGADGRERGAAAGVRRRSSTRFRRRRRKGCRPWPARASINLIWEPNTESRSRRLHPAPRPAPGDELAPITPAADPRNGVSAIAVAGRRALSCTPCRRSTRRRQRQPAVGAVEETRRR